jgi:hypothetical protein
MERLYGGRVDWCGTTVSGVFGDICNTIQLFIIIREKMPIKPGIATDNAVQCFIRGEDNGE